jgi:hypothetical protein
MIGTRPLSIALIGAVATSESARGRGLASRLLEALIGRLRDRGVCLLVLWTDRERFYERLGFHRAGVEWLHVVSRSILPAHAEGQVRRVVPGDAAILAALHDAEPGRMLRSQDDWRALIRIPRCHGYLLEKDDRAVSYAFVGKGLDLEGVLHEWGGDPASLPDLIAGVLERRRVPEIIVMSPPWKEATRRLFSNLGVPEKAGALGMLRILDAVGLLQACGQTLSAPVDPADPDLARRLFGDERAPEARAPLPFHLFGLDSM